MEIYTTTYNVYIIGPRNLAVELLIRPWSLEPTSTVTNIGLLWPYLHLNAKGLKIVETFMTHLHVQFQGPMSHYRQCKRRITYFAAASVR
jgi:hypothetical protein